MSVGADVEKGPVVEMLDLVYGCSCSANGHSWARVNYSMRTALELAVGSGFTFRLETVQYIWSNYRSGYWLGACDEWFYSLAVIVGNVSAAKGYERLKGREPFMGRKVVMQNRTQYLHASRVMRERERISVGAIFRYGGVDLVCNSFTRGSGNEGWRLNATVRNARGAKVDRQRFKLSAAEIAKDGKGV